MSVLCFLDFFTNLIYSSLKIISRICPEFFMSRICLVQIYHVRNLSRFICPEIVQNFSCPEFVQIYLSRICPEFSCPEFVQNLFRFIYPEIVQNFYTGQILDKFWTKSNFEYWICVRRLDNFWTISGHTKIFLNNFWTFSMTFSGHLFFIGLSKIQP